MIKKFSATKDPMIFFQPIIVIIIKTATATANQPASQHSDRCQPTTRKTCLKWYNNNNTKKKHPFKGPFAINRKRAKSYSPPEPGLKDWFPIDRRQPTNISIDFHSITLNSQGNFKTKKCLKLGEKNLLKTCWLHTA